MHMQHVCTNERMTVGSPDQKMNGGASGSLYLCVFLDKSRPLTHATQLPRTPKQVCLHRDRPIAHGTDRVHGLRRSGEKLIGYIHVLNKQPGDKLRIWRLATDPVEPVQVVALVNSHGTTLRGAVLSVHVAALQHFLPPLHPQQSQPCRAKKRGW